jgi:hypothetical protein
VYETVYAGEAPYTRWRNVWLPRVEAVIAGPKGKTIRRQVLVDSGADVSMIPLQGLRALGFNPSPASFPRRLLRRLVGAEDPELDILEQTRASGLGGDVTCFAVELTWHVCGASIAARVLVPVTPGFVHYVLGRDPFFRRLHFGFFEYEDSAMNRLRWRLVD